MFCIDCHQEGEIMHGSLQCESCQNKLFTRLRGALRDVKGATFKQAEAIMIATEERHTVIRELMKAGYKPTQIADKAGLALSTVYKYRKMILEESA